MLRSTPSCILGPDSPTHRPRRVCRMSHSPDLAGDRKDPAAAASLRRSLIIALLLNRGTDAEDLTRFMVCTITQPSPQAPHVRVQPRSAVDAINPVARWQWHQSLGRSCPGLTGSKGYKQLPRSVISSTQHPPMSLHHQCPTTASSPPPQLHSYPQVYFFLDSSQACLPPRLCRSTGSSAAAFSTSSLATGLPSP